MLNLLCKILQRLLVGWAPAGLDGVDGLKLSR